MLKVCLFALVLLSFFGCRHYPSQAHDLYGYTPTLVDDLEKEISEKNAHFRALRAETLPVYDDPNY